MSSQSVTAFKPVESAKNISSYRRENSFWKELALIDLDHGRNVANVRFYGAGATLYCVTWFHLWPYGFEQSCRGVGKAGGGGYHKASAAMSAALTDAGFTFAESIDGRGDGAMEDALKAIAAHLGIARPMIHQAHA